MRQVERILNMVRVAAVFEAEAAKADSEVGRPSPAVAVFTAKRDKVMAKLRQELESCVIG